MRVAHVRIHASCILDRVIGSATDPSCRRLVRVDCINAGIHMQHSLHNSYGCMLSMSRVGSVKALRILASHPVRRRALVSPFPSSVQCVVCMQRAQHRSRVCLRVHPGVGGDEATRHRTSSQAVLRPHIWQRVHYLTQRHKVTPPTHCLACMCLALLAECCTAVLQSRGQL